MVKSKVDQDRNWLKEMLAAEAEKRRTTPIVGERWFVVEHWPEERYSDEYSDTNWRPAKTVVVSGYFDSKEQAQQFVDTHEPEKGATLRIRYQSKRRITEDRWVNW